MSGIFDKLKRQEKSSKEVMTVSAADQEKDRQKRAFLESVHVCTYNIVVSYEWDPKKAASNLRKHGVDFAEAVIALEDELALTLDDDHPDERRFITIGADALGRLLVVSYTYRGEKIRIISAREATPRERRQYTEGL